MILILFSKGLVVLYKKNVYKFLALIFCKFFLSAILMLINLNYLAFRILTILQFGLSL